MVAGDGLREYDGLESLTENEMQEDSNEEDDSIPDSDRRSDFTPDGKKLLKLQKIGIDAEGTSGSKPSRQGKRHKEVIAKMNNFQVKARDFIFKNERKTLREEYRIGKKIGGEGNYVVGG